MTHDEFKRLEIAEGTHIEPCPLCAADAQLWQFSESVSAPTSKFVTCSHSDDLGPRDGLVYNGCVLYDPPKDFYKATIRDAVKHWNDYAKAATELQRKRRWERHSVLRQARSASAALQAEPQGRIPAGKPNEQNGCEQNVSTEGIEEASKP
jgi:hypothetical protein